MKLPLSVLPERTGARYEVRTPITGTVFASAPDLSPEYVEEVVRAAEAGAEELASLSAHERADICRDAAVRLRGIASAVAKRVVYETGRTLVSALDEVEKAASGLELAAEYGVQVQGDVVPVRAGHRVTYTSRHPLGVWAVLSPWNFPVNIPLEYLGPALVTGNGVVWKPAPSVIASSVLVATALGDALEAAGVSRSAVTLLSTDRIDTATALVTHPRIAGIGLTGSTATGNAIATVAGGKELIFELGGNGPVLVFSDADLERAAAAIAAGGFSASGQICSATGRVLADPTVIEELGSLVAAHASEYRLGDPFVDGTVIGPVHDAALASRIRARVSDALQAGARRATAEEENAWPSRCYLEPTVLLDVPLGHPIEAEETFGPVVPIVAVPDDELVKTANAAAHALSVAVFTSDYSTALSAAATLKYGSVIINDRASYWELHLPFGGWNGKSSGTGRVGVPEVIRRMTQIRTTTLAW